MRKLKILATSVILALAWIGTVAAQTLSIYQYLGITGQATTTLKTGPGILHTICFNAPTATEVVTIYDNSTNAGTKIGTITVPASPQPGCLLYDVQFGTGLTIVTATASSDITVSYR